MINFTKNGLTSLGQNVNYINLIENGKRLPSLQGFFAICDYLGVTPAEFFGEKEAEQPCEISELDALFEQLSLRQKQSIAALIRAFSE